MVTASTIAADLRALGLDRANRVLVHSSLRAIGPVEGGADAVVDALLDVVGDQGLVVAPTFTYDNRRFDGSEPGRTGAISEAVRQRAGACRSAHPTHSVAAIGPDAPALCHGHEERAATDVDTPLDRLARRGGSVLLLGVGHIANTTVHVGEFRARVPYLTIPFSPSWPREHVLVTAEGEERVVSYNRFPGCSRSFGIVERGLRRRGAVHDGAVGSALAQLVAAQAVIDETKALLDEDPAALLCTDSRCYRCTRGRDLIRDRAEGADCGG